MCCANQVTATIVAHFARKVLARVARPLQYIKIRIHAIGCAFLYKKQSKKFIIILTNPENICLFVLDNPEIVCKSNKNTFHIKITFARRRNQIIRITRISCITITVPAARTRRRTVLRAQQTFSSAAMRLVCVDITC